MNEDKDELIELLSNASKICGDNMYDVSNIDLYEIMKTLDSIIEDLESIDEFEGDE